MRWIITRDTISEPGQGQMYGPRTAGDDLTMQLVELLPVDKRARQLIKQHGKVWMVIERRPVICFDGEEGILVRSMDQAHERWVRPENLVNLARP